MCICNLLSLFFRRKRLNSYSPLLTLTWSNWRRKLRVTVPRLKEVPSTNKPTRRHR